MIKCNLPKGVVKMTNKDKPLEKGTIVKSIWRFIEVGDKVRYKGQVIQIERKSMLDKMYCLKDTDQLYKNDKLFAERFEDKWKIL